MELPLYTPGEKLKDDEFLLKIRKGTHRDREYSTGFMTKLTKKGEIPVAFADWGKTYTDRTPLPAYVFVEKYRSGWEIIGWRFGKSQNWATVKHPEGFTVEIYLQQLLEIIQSTNVQLGVLEGEYRWEDHKLIKK